MRTLPTTVKGDAHEVLDVEVDDVQGHLVFSKPHLPASVRRALDQPKRARGETDDAAARAG